jgi:excisionase family DNA binding protein
MGNTVTPTLIRVSEAARLAGVSRQHVYRLIDRGAIEAVRVGDNSGPIRVAREPFLHWLYADPNEGGKS